MTCCATPAAVEAATAHGVDAEWANACTKRPDGSADLVLVVPGISCGGCISKIERNMAATPGILSARVNLTLKRLALRLETPEHAADARRQLTAIGYAAHPFITADAQDGREDARMRHLIRALAVAGFATGNIMLLSVSVWSGATGPTRDLFHLVSAFIAIPAAAFAGQVFYRSAFAALRRGQLNMDVPITLAILLALGMSLYETLTGGPEAYFDAAAMLLFFLLIGRTLDQMMRNRAQTAVKSLAHLAAKGADVVEDGGVRYHALEELEPGMHLSIPPGGRIPVDGTVLSGTSDLDRALVTGEADPVAVSPGMSVEAGTLNLTGPLILRADQTAEHSFLAEVMRMMTAAEEGRGQYRRIADRLAQIYAPAVHLLAAFTFLGWLATGADWQTALYIAIAVLIVTCPCALGLAVPVTHVVAAGRLFSGGTLMKDGSALERLAEADTALFDKTGTVTTGAPSVTRIDGL
ncbi:MAG: heavy metal translocating P-type ATPase, partial [Pseudomonadota bacterium]